MKKNTQEVGSVYGRVNMDPGAELFYLTSFCFLNDAESNLGELYNLLCLLQLLL